MWGYERIQKSRKKKFGVAKKCGRAGIVKNYFFRERFFVKGRDLDFGMRFAFEGGEALIGLCLLGGKGMVILDRMEKWET